MGSSAIAYLFSSEILRVTIPYPIINDPIIDRYAYQSGVAVLHPTQDCLLLLDGSNIYFLEPNFTLNVQAMNTTGTIENFWVEEMEGVVTFVVI